MLPVNWKGTAVWSGVTALATWMASGPAVVAPGSPAVPGAPIRPALAAQAQPVQPLVDLTGEAERLARRLDEQQAFADPVRDPFQFKAPAAPVRVVVPVALPPAAVVAPVAAAPPPFTLVGVAEDRQGDTVVRTAVVNGAGEMWLVKAGEKVEGKFEVTAVDADAVELIRADTGTAVRLTFRP